MEINLIKSNVCGLEQDLKGLTKKEQANKIIEEMLTFSGHVAGKCYSPQAWEGLSSEPKEDADKRVRFCLSKMHHSIFEHSLLTFEMNKIPKFLCMILNNENVYTTSEQSGRYTNFATAGETELERTLYIKWFDKFIELITNEYEGKLKPDHIVKLAQENARAMTSVFVPSSMIHSISLRQLNYVIYYMENFLKGDSLQTETEKKFMEMLRPRLNEFLEEVSIWKVEGLIPKTKVELSMFEPSLAQNEIFDVIYTRTYPISFSAHAQNQRHRTIRYRMKLMDRPTYYVPKILKGTELEKEWLEDMTSLKDIFPQGMEIIVNETGEVKDFVRKCYERCCGRAQIELQEITNTTLDIYRKECKNELVLKYIEDNLGSVDSRCLFPGYKCVEPCAFGVKQRERKI